MAAAPGGEGIIGVPVCIRGARVILVEETRTIDPDGTARGTAREGRTGGGNFPGKFRREFFLGGLPARVWISWGFTPAGVPGDFWVEFS